MDYKEASIGEIISLHPIIEGEKKGVYYSRIVEIAKQNGRDISWKGVEYAFRGLSVNLKNFCDERNINPDTVKMYWAKGEGMSVLAINTTPVVDVIEDAIDRIIESLGVYEIHNPVISHSNLIGILVMTDEHIGLSPGDDSLFSYKYGREEYMSSLKVVLDNLVEKRNVYGIFKELCIHNLGDALDGYEGFTTRGGHKLEQNMSSASAFELALEGRIWLLRQIFDNQIAENVVFRSCSNDNHSGSFSEILNVATKKLTEVLFNGSVEIDILTRFMEHRVYGDHCFILTHGKDKVHMKRAMPINLTDGVIKIVTQYIKHYGITNKYIHVQKGDLHQISYQHTKLFDYRNFGTFAPPSGFLQHNYGDGYACFHFQVVDPYRQDITYSDCFLDYKKVG